jgi:hypothetical protein
MGTLKEMKIATYDSAGLEADFWAHEEERTADFFAHEEEMVERKRVSAQAKVAHNIHVLHAVCDDLVQGYYGDAREHRCIADSKAELGAIENMLRGLL